MKKLTLILLAFCVSSAAMAQDYLHFADNVKFETEQSRQEGLSYLVSGGIALVGGAFGYSQATKPVEKGFYSLAQSFGLIAIGVGAESYFLKQDNEIFLQVLKSTDLTMAQKDEMVRAYLKERRDREESIAWIRRTTFGLAGILNVIYASQTKDDTLKNLLYLTAGVQLVWAVTF